MKKKLLALMLAMVMMLSLSVTAFASSDTDPDSTTEETTEEESEEEEEAAVTSSPTVVKVVSGENAPSETYSFTVTATGMSNTASGVTTQPTVTVDTIKGSGSATLDLSNITAIGIYTYTIKETAGNTAGVEYDETVYTLKVTAYFDDNGVLQKAVAITKDGAKQANATFTNTYTANTLTVTKQVTGNLGDTTKEFSFTVTFENKDEATTWVNNITATDSSSTTITCTEADGVYSYTFTLKSGASATFTNIPSGISYTVTESDYSNDGYKTTYSNESGTMSGSDITTTVTNDKDQTVDTGISLDSLPYILMLIVVAAGVVVMISRRRLNDRF
ncbi:MAG: DUF5979 domain-containing protein [Lachnospiraceae bacterium]|nr:DUF5979 domain-containing protein [Lachnospiraceae bacterium]